MLKQIVNVALVMALVLGLASAGWAGVVHNIDTSTGSRGADAWIRGEDGLDDDNPDGFPDSNYGNSITIRAKRNDAASQYRKAYIRFDLAGVIVSNVTHATLRLTTSILTSQGGTFSVYGLNQSYNSDAGLDGWTEGEGNLANDGGITWNNSLSTGDYYAGNATGNAVTDATLVGSFAISDSTSAGAVYSIDSDDSASLLTFIQADTDFKVTFVVVCDTDGSETGFGSKENTVYDNPLLTLEETLSDAPIAEPSSLGLLGLALLGLRKRRS
jgi:hypothetical protein